MVTSPKSWSVLVEESSTNRRFFTETSCVRDSCVDGKDLIGRCLSSPLVHVWVTLWSFRSCSDCQGLPSHRHGLNEPQTCHGSKPNELLKNPLEMLRFWMILAGSHSICLCKPHILRHNSRIPRRMADARCQVRMRATSRISPPRCQDPSFSFGMVSNSLYFHPDFF